MIEVRLAGVSTDSSTGQPVIVLEPLDELSARALPIWIGRPEATSILFALQDIRTSRPMTHDLLLSIIRATGFSVMRVEVTRVEGDTFYACIRLRNGHEEAALDARPSDCIAIAVRVGCPILVEAAVMDEASIIIEDAQEAKIAEFHDFIEHVDPEDFSIDS